MESMNLHMTAGGREAAQAPEASQHDFWRRYAADFTTQAEMMLKTYTSE